MRIVSLLPGTTEIVCALGLGDHLVAVTHECDYPPEVRGLPVVTRSMLEQDESSSAEIDAAIRERAQRSLDLPARHGIDRGAPARCDLDAGAV